MSECANVIRRKSGNHFQKSTNMVSQSDWFGSWPLLVPQRIKHDSKIGPTSVIFVSQNAQNATCSQSSSKRKIYYNCPEHLIYLTPNKVHFRCFGVLTSIKIGLRFDVNLETAKKGFWRPQEAEKSRRRLFRTIVGPKSKSRGAQDRPQSRSKTQKSERNHCVNADLSLLAPLAGARGQLGRCGGRFGIDLGSMWGRCWGQFWAMLGRI
jgi:hypothetical protein